MSSIFTESAYITAAWTKTVQYQILFELFGPSKRAGASLKALWTASKIFTVKTRPPVPVLRRKAPNSMCRYIQGNGNIGFARRGRHFRADFFSRIVNTPEKHLTLETRINKGLAGDIQESP
jgi:hypothetical protein